MNFHSSDLIALAYISHFISTTIGRRLKNQAILQSFLPDRRNMKDNIQKTVDALKWIMDSMRFI